jgi:hypothetical protein
LREKAIAWLADKEGSKPLLALAEENAAQKARIEAMERQIAKLVAASGPKKATKKRAPMSADARAKLSEMMKARNAAKAGEGAKKLFCLAGARERAPAPGGCS